MFWQGKNDLKKLFKIQGPQKPSPKNDILGVLYQKGTKNEIPLLSIAYEVEINDSLAYITLSQNYLNGGPTPIETEYSFAISEKACFYEFKAEIDGQIMIGEIKEKQEAKAEYELNKSMGNTVAYSEMDEEVKDIMKINIGNIPANKTLRIQFGYLQELDIFLNKFWKLIIPATLGSRYTPPAQQKNFDLLGLGYNVPQIPQVQGYPWTIKITLNSKSEISFIRSPSHDIKITPIDQSHNLFTIEFDKLEMPNKDFTFLFGTKEFNETRVTVGKNDEKETPYCAMINLMPSFNPCSNEDAFQAYINDSAKTNYEVNLLTAKGEYLFLLDRSGSMSGERIRMASESLVLFLKSLPPDSYFNIIGFGTSHEKMFSSSRKTDEIIINQTVRAINQIKADLGGTNIYNPLNEAMNSFKIEQYPKNIFILTDGDVSNVNEILNLITKFNDLCRVYTIGVGNGCSREIIVEGARLGKGKHEFIAENEQMNEKIVSLLEDSITPFLSNFIMNYDKSVIEIIAPTPESISFIRKNEEFRIFVFLNSKFSNEKHTFINIQYYDNYLNKVIVKEIPIILTDLVLPKDYLHKYGAYQVIKRIQRNLSYEKDYQSDIYLAQKDDLETYCLNFALKYQILTPFTSFICVIKQNQNFPFMQNAEKLVIPTIQSKDYKKNDDIDLIDQMSSLLSNNLLLKKKSMPKQSMERQDKCKRAPTLPSQKTREMCDAIDYFSEVEKTKSFNPIKCFDSLSLNNFGGGLFGSTASASIKTLSSTNEEESPPEKQKPIWLELLEKQKYEGFWELNENNASLIGKNIKSVTDCIPFQFSGLGQEVYGSAWITCIILYFYETFYQDKIGSTKLIIKKAELWLKNKGVPYSELKELIKKIFFGVCLKSPNIIPLIKFCKCGKSLVNTKNIPAYNGELFCCDQCGATNLISGGVFHCEPCQFDLCEECNNNSEIFCNLCKTGPLKFMKTIPDPNYVKYYWCDVCIKQFEIDHGVYHCIGCGKFDLCLKCKSIR